MPVPVLAILAAAQAMAQPPACTVAAPPPPALAAWSTPVAVTAATDGGRADAALLRPGIAADVALAPASSVHYAMTPGHQGAAGSFGGVVTLMVVAAGRYQVAAGEGAWIDVVASGRTLASVAHGHGPACSGIRKIVSFDLAPGRYAIQLSGAAAATVRLLVAPQTG